MPATRPHSPVGVEGDSDTCLWAAGSSSSVDPTSPSTGTPSDEKRRIQHHLPHLPLELQHLIIKHSSLDEPMSWTNYQDHARLFHPLLRVHRSWLPAVRAELVRELTLTSMPQAQAFAQHYNNIRLLTRVEVFRIGGDEAKSWPALIHADAMEANFLLSHCHNLRQLWVRNLQLVEFGATKIPTLRSLFVFYCSFKPKLSDNTRPPRSSPPIADYAASARRGAPGSDLRASLSQEPSSASSSSLSKPSRISKRPSFPHVSRLYIVNCQVTPSILETLTHKIFPLLTALAFGSNWVQSPRRSRFLDDGTNRISLAHIDRSLFDQLTCLSVGDELGQVLLLTPRLVLLDCWRTALVSSRVVKSLPTSLRFLRMCESMQGDASFEEEEALEEEEEVEEEEEETEGTGQEVEQDIDGLALASDGSSELGDQRQVGEASGTNSEEERLGEGLSPARKRMAALVRRLDSSNGLLKLSELHVPKTWEGGLYKDVVTATKRKGGNRLGVGRRAEWVRSGVLAIGRSSKRVRLPKPLARHHVAVKCVELQLAAKGRK